MFRLILASAFLKGLFNALPSNDPAQILVRSFHKAGYQARIIEDPAAQRKEIERLSKLEELH
jgi:hypothetical protein